MPGVGITFVGVIGVGPRIPDVLVSSARTQGAGENILTVGAPSGIRVGDQMVACYGAGAWSGGGGPYTLTNPAAWSVVLDEQADSGTNQVITNLYSKVADQDDEDGIASYSWNLSVGTLPGHAVTVLGWRSNFGNTVDNPSVDHASSDPSLSSPGGLWQLSFIYQRTASSFVQPAPDPVVTSSATLLHFNGSLIGGTEARAGNMRVYGSSRVSPISGAYLETGINFPRQGLVVAAVST